MVSSEPVAALCVYGRCNTACGRDTAVLRPPSVPFLPGCWSRGVVVCMPGQAWGRGPWGPGHGRGAGMGHGTIHAAASGCVGRGYCLHVDVLLKTAAQQRIPCKVKFLICGKCGAFLLPGHPTPSIPPRHNPVCCRSSIRTLNGMRILVEGQFGPDLPLGSVRV